MMLKLSIQMDVSIGGFNRARGLAEALAARHNIETMLISWADRERGVHSPQCLKCEINGRPGWEVYGENHGGRVMIGVNDDQYVFIYS
jgi:hypothetical protein